MNNKLALVIGLATVSTLLIQNNYAQERTWNDNTGKFSTKAELIEIGDTTIKIRRADNGKLVDVPIEILSDKDKEFIKEQRESSAASDEPARGALSINDIELTAVLEEAEVTYFDENGKELPKNFDLIIDATGPATKQAIQFGNVKVAKLSGNDGKKLKEVESFQFSEDGLEKVERPDNDFFKDHPDDGVRIRVTIERPDFDLDMVSAEGSFQVVTGGTRQTAKIENVKGLVGQRVRNRLLKDHGVKSRILFEDGTYSVELQGDIAKVISLEFASADGKPLESVSESGFFSMNDTIQHMFMVEGELPDDAMLHMVLAIDTQKMTVPYSFEKIQLK